MRKPMKIIALVLTALILLSCNLVTQNGPFSAEPTADLIAQTLTAMAPDFESTLTALAPSSTPPNTQVPAAATAIPSTSEPLVLVPTATPTLTQIPPTATPTGSIPVIPITPISPYATPVVNPPAPPPQTLTRISFLSNATSGSAAGTLNAGETRSFVLQVGGARLMMVDVTSPNQDVFLRIYGRSTGQILLDSGMGAGQSSWQGRVPVTQDYIVDVISRGGAANFNLNVIIPEPVFFDPGAVSTSRTYPLRPRETHTLLLRAAAGQDMTLTLTPSDQTVLLAFYGYDDGLPYLRTVAGQTSWTGKVPAAQDYVIEVVSVVDASTNFKLDIVIK